MSKNNKLLIEIKKEYCKRKFYNFFKLFWGVVESTPFVDNWHIEMLCDELQRRFELWLSGTIDEEQLYDLIINLPPGSSKSLITSVFFPAWAWLIAPHSKFITASYSHKVAEDHASKSLRLLENEKYQEISNFTLTATAVNNIKNNKGGQRFVTSTNGTVTGMHADFIICDDINGPQSIYSATDREQTRKFIQEILPSRKTNLTKSATLYIQQRFHDEDATGLLLKGKKKIKNVKVSAINENGESFWPERFTLQALDVIKETLGSISFNAQYLQITQKCDGGIIKAKWLKEIETYNNQKLTYFIDTAYGNKDGKDTDDNAIVGCFKDQNNLIIQTCDVNKLEFPDFINHIKNIIPAYSTVYIEGKASGKSVIQMLRLQTNLNIIETQPSGGKLEIKTTCSPFFEAGRIFINKYIDNKQTLISQLIFDNLKHDDISDCIMNAINNLLKKSQGGWV